MYRLVVHMAIHVLNVCVCVCVCERESLRLAYTKGYLRTMIKWNLSIRVMIINTFYSHLHAKTKHTKPTHTDTWTWREKSTSHVISIRIFIYNIIIIIKVVKTIKHDNVSLVTSLGLVSSIVQGRSMHSKFLNKYLKYILISVFGHYTVFVIADLSVISSTWFN